MRISEDDCSQDLPGMARNPHPQGEAVANSSQFLVGVFASLGSFNYGYDLGVIGGSVAADSFIAEFHPNADEVYVLGWNVASRTSLLTSS